MDKSIITDRQPTQSSVAQPTWAERHAAIMARAAGSQVTPAQHGLDFEHGVTRYNMPRCTTRTTRRERSRS